MDETQRDDVTDLMNENTALKGGLRWALLEAEQQAHVNGAGSILRGRSDFREYCAMVDLDPHDLHGVEMVKVESSNVAAVGYARGDLHVQFKGGSKVYVYGDVPHEVHAEMMASESVGRFLNQKIKGKYQHRVSE